MIIANFEPGNDYKRVSGLTQWDYGQMLRIQGLDLPAAVEIHFSLQDIGGESITRIGTTADGVTDVVIPDSMLENEEEMGEQYSVFAYIYLSNSESGETIKKIEMIVSTRPKPEAWDKPEDQELFHEAIEAVNAAADRAEAAEGNAVQSAESARSDATKTAEDRKAVEELVKMTSGIEEQVEQVKEYKEQAATAATNAALSEQAAKTAKDAAIQAQTAAEIAEDAAEQHAIAAAGDKAEVERMAGQVATDKQTVAQDKADVEKKVSDFELTAQQAVADVNNAGQEQVEHVKSAGETAVKELNAAKDTAAQEINSAKDTSVQAVNSAGQEQAAAVQAEGEKVIDSIPEDYQTAMDGKLDKQQGVENAGKALVVGEDGQITPGDYSGNANMEQLLALAIKQKTEQAEMLHITDSAEFPIVSISGQGYTEQETASGKNLIDVKEITADTKDTAIECNFAQTVYFSVQGEPPTVKKSVWRFKFDFSDGETVYVTDDEVLAGGKAFRASEEKIITKITYRGVYIESGKYNKIQIEKGETKSEWEPYTGGKPSPSPLYPQEIKMEGQEEGDQYKRAITVSNKNLFDRKYAENRENWQIGINYPYISVLVGKGNKITISYMKELSTGLGFYAYVAKEKGASSGGYGWLYHSGSAGLIHNKLTFEAEEDYIYLSVSGTNSNTQQFMDAIGNTLQIEIGEKNTSYVEHEKQKVEIVSDRPISKWDRLEMRDGVYGWLRKTKRMELTGEEEWLYYANKIVNQFYFVDAEIEHSANEINAISNKFIGAKIQDRETKKDIVYTITDGVAIGTDVAKTVEDWKAWLAQKSVSIIVKTVTEEFVPLKEEEQRALKELCTYYPTTIITTDTGLLLQANYVADTQTYIQNNYEPKTELESIKERVAALERAAIE